MLYYCPHVPAPHTNFTTSSWAFPLLPSPLTHLNFREPPFRTHISFLPGWISSVSFQAMLVIAVQISYPLMSHPPTLCSPKLHITITTPFLLMNSPVLNITCLWVTWHRPYWVWLLSLWAYWQAHTQGNRKCHLHHLSNVVITYGLSKLCSSMHLLGLESHALCQLWEAWWMVVAMPVMSLLPVPLSTCLQCDCCINLSKDAATFSIPTTAQEGLEF